MAQLRGALGVAGALRVAIVDDTSFAPFVAAGAGNISFVLYARARTSADPDEGTAPPPKASAPATGPAAPQRPPSPRGASVGVDCQDCTFPCESTKRDCERRCFVDEREASGRRACNRTCEQMLRSCLRSCPGCW